MTTESHAGLADQDPTQVAAWVTARVAEFLETPPEAIDPDMTLADLGLSSLQAVQLAGDLEIWLGRPVEPTIVYDHPTIVALSEHAATQEPS